jgi:hypothetical protein
VASDYDQELIPLKCEAVNCGAVFSAPFGELSLNPDRVCPACKAAFRVKDLAARLFQAVVAKL